jgi:hypothetical protein
MLGVRRRHDLAQVCQERTSLLSLLHKHAAAIHRVHLAPGEAQFAQPVQGTGDGGLETLSSAAKPRTVCGPAVR